MFRKQEAIQSIVAVVAFGVGRFVYLLDRQPETTYFLPHWIAKIVPGWFNGIPFLENTVNYFLRGTFDPTDLVSIAGGTVAAYLTILLTQQMECRNATYG